MPPWMMDLVLIVTLLIIVAAALSHPAVLHYCYVYFGLVLLELSILIIFVAALLCCHYVNARKRHAKAAAINALRLQEKDRQLGG